MPMKFKLLLWSLLAALVVGCSSDKVTVAPESTDPSISVDEFEIEIGCDGGRQAAFFTIKNPVEGQNVTADVSA